MINQTDKKNDDFDNIFKLDEQEIDSKLQQFTNDNSVIEIIEKNHGTLQYEKGKIILKREITEGAILTAEALTQAAQTTGEALSQAAQATGDALEKCFTYCLCCLVSASAVNINFLLTF